MPQTVFLNIISFETPPILEAKNKVSAFATNPLLRAVIGQPKSSFNFRDAMDSKKIILCDLSKGALGEDVSSLLGSLIMTKLYLASLSRQDTPEDERVRHHSFIDEVHNFSYGVDLSSILAEARKYRLSLTVATQTLAQLRRYNPEVLHSIFGNVGTLSSFRVSGEDAKILAEEFANDITARQLETLADYEFFIRTLENKPKSPALMQSQPRRIVGYPPLSFDNPQSKERIVKQSNQRYTRQRADVDRWLNKKLSVSFKLEN